MSREPKYASIARALRTRIESGVWQPGEAIPHERALASEFGVTRPTISRALRGLVEAGLVERRRRAGSRVAERRGRAALLRIPVVRDEIEAAGGRYGYVLLERCVVPPPPATRALFNLPGEACALHVTSLHLADGRPHQLEDRWINLSALPQAAEHDFSDESPNEWLVRTVPWSRAEHIFRAAAAQRAEADALGLGPCAPVFVIERRTWRGDEALTSVRLLHPAGSFAIVSRDPDPG